jgi:hypothetical protein
VLPLGGEGDGDGGEKSGARVVGVERFSGADRSAGGEGDRASAENDPCFPAG